ncbi:unannotated protein [freshwater metagenome]|uniref:Unannotated protein n=1 Tax=freshwater metagenome TaxID=449393 RepID=A0A6J7RFY1_9ZZZZ
MLVQLVDPSLVKLLLRGAVAVPALIKMFPLKAVVIAPAHDGVVMFVVVPEFSVVIVP